jgi:hypothetical protein
VFSEEIIFNNGLLVHRIVWISLGGEAAKPGG